ncbi:MAG: hypothetical protein KA974_02500 [Saprospiraceae bacterium]|nr:hypothetical protein [Saprospiraceae bacterium]MBP7680048.1 hypothetical protein [Saprospiraceae bacterium]
MSLFSKIFGSPQQGVNGVSISFGRYTDLYKSPEQQQAWEQALQLFNEYDVLPSYQRFFDYINNVSFNSVTYQTDTDGSLQFKILQGSKKIIGYATLNKFYAEAKIAKADLLNVGFMRRLVEYNYTLRYTRFAIDDNSNITIIFDTPTLDGSPYKIYYALKELATNADKQDDLLLATFKMLQPIDDSHVIPQSENIKAAKHQFIIQAIQTVSEQVDKGQPSIEQYAGGVAYLLLNLVYKIDYLTKPEGMVMEILEKIHRTYFTEDGKTAVVKLNTVYKELKKITERSKEDFHEEFYDTVCTFGLTTPTEHDKVIEFIATELPNTDWYIANGYHNVALAIPQYIAGFCLFSFALPRIDKDLLHLFFEVTEWQYFQAVKHTQQYFDGVIFNRKNIIKRINTLVKAEKCKIKTDVLLFDNLLAFAQSYLKMMSTITFSD